MLRECRKRSKHSKLSTKNVQSCGNPKIITNYHSKLSPSTCTCLFSDGGFIPMILCCDRDGLLTQWDTCSTLQQSCRAWTEIINFKEINALNG
ncbi:CLUMA_CG003571, isoform A [Clunio marinus]|uniref:CLUMA_CG003571, isoform A n=1 Tax=Clunio marinus TaxID=568069 RepID=A0A1J1HNL4_9DIPT|nr:CLUMA_CG003571, isoform A [Clunio marinus]